MTLHFLYHRDQIPQLPDKKKKKKKTKQTQNFKVNVIFSSKFPLFMGSKGWRSGLSLLLVLSFAARGFSPGTPVFPSPQKPTFPNSNSTRNQVDEEPLCGCATSKLSFNYLFIYLFIPIPCSAAHTLLGQIKECLPSPGNDSSGQFRAVLMSIWVYKTS